MADISKLEQQEDFPSVLCGVLNPEAHFLSDKN